MKTFTVNAEARPEHPTAVVTATLSVAEIGPWLAEQYQRIAAVFRAGPTFPIGPPFARCHKTEPDPATWRTEITQPYRSV